MSAPRTVSQYLDAFRDADPSSRRFDTPMLVVRRVSTDDEDERAFHTKFAERVPQASMTPPSSDAPLLAGCVIPIVKREGGAFADRIGVGRAPNVDVRIALTQVSKYHAFFSKAYDDTWSLTDAGSRNGTFVNERRLAPKLPVSIEDGDVVGIGPHRLVFHTPDGFVSVLQRRPPGF